MKGVLKMEKEMNDLKLGDRVKVIYLPLASKLDGTRITIGMKGTIKDLSSPNVGIEFDRYIGGHNGVWNGINGHCWYIAPKCLEKIEDTEEETKEEVEGMKKEVNEETKAETFDQKILETLREEIGVEVGEVFDVYEKGEHWATCKFEGNKLLYEAGDEFYIFGDATWKHVVCNFSMYTFKRKPFIPEYGEHYFFLAVGYDKNKNISFNWGTSTWADNSIDYGRLALENVFRSQKEALENKDKLLEKMEKLRKGE